VETDHEAEGKDGLMELRYDVGEYEEIEKCNFDEGELETTVHPREPSHSLITDRVPVRHVSMMDGTLSRGLPLTPLGVLQGQKPYNETKDILKKF